jgi:molecular chaperone GrpE
MGAAGWQTAMPFAVLFASRSDLVIVPPDMSSEPEKVETNGAPEGEHIAEPEKAEKPQEAAAKKSSAPPPAAEPTAEQKLAEAQAEAGRLRDQLLRTAADFDNFRKRSRRDESDALRRGREALLKDLLPVFDNLERAVQHADSATEVKPVVDGLRMVLKQFVDTIDKVQVKRIQAVGQPFDPSKHEAIQQLESKDVPAGVVMHEVQTGYTIGDALLRAAMVVVSKGPPEGAG